MNGNSLLDIDNKNLSLKNRLDSFCPLKSHSNNHSIVAGGFAGSDQKASCVVINVELIN